MNLAAAAARAETQPPPPRGTRVAGRTASSRRPRARPLCACADARDAASWKSPKYFEAPSEASAAGAAYVATAPAAAADLPTFSIFSFGASAKMASTTSFRADSPGVGDGALPSPSSPSLLVSFLCFFAGGSRRSRRPTVVTSACTNSSAAFLAVTPDDLPPSASASSMASRSRVAHRVDAGVLLRSSAKRSSSRARKSRGEPRTEDEILERADAPGVDAREVREPRPRGVPRGFRFPRRGRTDSRHAEASATAASAASAVGSRRPRPDARSHDGRNADESSIDAWRVTRALANRNARLAAIQSSSDAVPSTTALEG